MAKGISSETVDNFIHRQLEAWPMAKSNFEALSAVEVKDIDVDGMHFKVQFNPARIVSSAAKVDAASLKARKCFLCSANRPAEQTGLEYGRYTVLINPFPIFPRHLTIPDQNHTDQLIEGRIADMMQLASEIDQYTIFYNGPRCGASAPDHMHFQAGNSDFLTIAPALEAAELSVICGDEDSCRLSMCKSLPVKVFVIDASTPALGAEMFGRLYRAIPVPEGEKEPMMNLLCYATPAGIRLVVVPRKRHRPSFYGTEGEGTMLISPASVDVGGVFITPRPEDFKAMDAGRIKAVLDEVCLNGDEMDEIANNIN